MSNNGEKVGATLVIGGGIAGMQASLDLASSGIKVYMAEAKPYIGGVMSQLDKTFPTNDCAMCTMSPRLVEISGHTNIDIITLADIESIEGEVGNFTVTLKKRARFVDEEKCTGCGSCVAVCPLGKVKPTKDKTKEKKLKAIPDEYNQELGYRSAIYIPFAQAIPNCAVIDSSNCIFLKSGKCGQCQKVCKAGAVDFKERDKTIKLNVGAVILSPGYELFDPKLKPDYGAGKFENVITALKLERILSASGPFQGKALRPSDMTVPKRMAFIQCVGSRDHERDYCSGVCCMYATKEAMIAKEHIGNDLQCDVFYMDIRAFSKGFEEYYQRAKDKGINYIRCRVPSIEEVSESNNLIINYLTENDQKFSQEYDLVVLSTGLMPPKSAKELSDKFDISLNEHGFCQSEDFSPVNSSKEGIFVAGTFTGPKDIPETVTQASSAASKVLSLLTDERGKLVSQKEYPPETDVTGQEARIGVFVCHCGKNIGGVANVPEIVEYAKTLPDVVFAEDNLYMCSTDGTDTIQKRIVEHNLNRVVVASCTPRTHEPLFRGTVRDAGLNEYLFEMANIREHCTWAHMDQPDAATEKAKGLVNMAVSKAQLLKPLYSQKVPINQDCLVIGGGISGMSASLELAEQGFHVSLIETEEELGGNARNIHYLLGDNNPQEFLNELIGKVKSFDNLDIYTKSEIVKIDGSIGKFKTVIKQNENEREIEHGAVIVATGAVEHKPISYLYGKNNNVVTQQELEQLLSKEGMAAPDTVVMIQCVESRNDERPYCSRICCSHAVKNALKIKEKYPDTAVYVLYRDMRTFGFLEGYYTKARQMGVVFGIYNEDNKPEVTEPDNNGKLQVRYFDTTLQADIDIDADYVALSTPVVPRPDNKELASTLKVPLDQNKFFLEAHMKLRPVDFATDGVYLCGLAHYPKSIDDSIVQAGAAAAKASALLAQDFMETEAAISVVDPAKCIGCGTCVTVCPYNAPVLEDVEVRVEEVVYMAKKSTINPAACKGCGSCAAECPAGAITAQRFSLKEINVVLDAFKEGVKSVVIEEVVEVEV